MRPRHARLVLLCTAVALRMVAAEPSNCRLYLAGQYTWEGTRGFYLDLEGTTLSELPVILGTADGQRWEFARHTPGFVPGCEYRILAVLRPEAAELHVDGSLVARLEHAWLPVDRPFEVNVRPSWATEPGDWVALMKTVEVAVVRDGVVVEFQALALHGGGEEAVPLRLFEAGRPTDVPDVRPQQGDTLRVSVTLSFVSTDLRRWAPFIDPYGQSRHARFPGKVASDSDLRDDIGREDARLASMPPPEGLDPYGGTRDAPWKESPTGFFRTVRREGRWWLVTPDGNPCFYIGVCNVPASTWPTTPVSGREFVFEWLPPREGVWNGAWSANHWGTSDGTAYASLHSANLIRKHGDVWQERAVERAGRRLAAWGFMGGGKWGAPPNVVCTPVLYPRSTPRIGRHPDVFDPTVKDALRRDLAKQIEPRREDPFVLGWSIGNEYDEVITPEEVIGILGKGGTVPAKRALVDHAVAERYAGQASRAAAAWQVEADGMDALYESHPTPPAEDVEILRRFYADRYYSLLYQTVKSIDPDHLYLGYWIVPGWWVNESDWDLIAPHCDVIGYDRYSASFADEQLTRLAARTDKPIFCGEFSFPAWYDGQRGYGRYGAVHARDDGHAGELYARWVNDASIHPHCVGLLWFHYRDQPLTGRGPGREERLCYGEHFAFGLITITDRPKWPMVERMRAANLGATRRRLGLAPPGK